MLVTANGVVTRINAGSISQQGRPATGIKPQNLNDGDYVGSVNKIITPDTSDSALKTAAKEDAGDNQTQQTSLLDTPESKDEN